jgi:hypothetical protein
MNRQHHIFWGSRSPLASLSGGGLLIIASARLAYAITTAGALLWVYGLSVLAAHTLSRIFPDKGKALVLIFLASFFSALYLWLFYLISPLAALEVFFPVSLVPLFCAGSGVFKRAESLDLGEAAVRALSEAAVFGGLVALFALIREPLGFCSLSLPGGSRGIVFLFYFEDLSFLPVRLAASSAGALLLLGYGVGLYRYFRKIHAPREDEL